MATRRESRGRGGIASALWFGGAAVVLAAALSAGACSASGSDDDDDGAGASGTGATGAGGSSTGGGGNTTQGGGTSVGGNAGGGGGGSVVTVPLCQPACGDVSECDLGAAYLDPDNHSCADGYCHFEGCNSDAECQTVGMICRDPGTGVPNCVTPCNVPEDCSAGQAPFDADNYACPNGYCEYTGCNSDAECQAIGDYLCRDGGWGVAICQVGCTVPADCDMQSAPYDADNYACPDGYCVYTGCNSDTECQSLGNYVCR